MSDRSVHSRLSCVGKHVLYCELRSTLPISLLCAADESEGAGGLVSSSRLSLPVTVPLCRLVLRLSDSKKIEPCLDTEPSVYKLDLF